MAIDALTLDIPVSNRKQRVARVPNSGYIDDMPRREKGPDEMTSREAAKLLGITLPRFYELVNEGTIQKHYRKLVKRPYYSRREMETLLAEDRGTTDTSSS